ncbi:ankyrin repeat domain-containing protein 2 [Podospora aff. communis PSN243]|uniref:Ankyrin repeat domain-containing protein 2 n=1 Tax=Podospora aff. communis PSN243 TaxID=3040156 RepID=A0AAV9GL85_9PEZI|nr:ankyrin repeat domain-containing protein 2 [Podospora aff. communis PSN243]
MEGVISSPSPPAGKNPRRGRREKPWPPAKQRKLLRLYVCTQSERLPLKRILERLKDGEFDPRQRNTHKHLRSLLPDRRIDDWRPRDMATMMIRVRFLRSVKAERRMRNRRARSHLCNMNRQEHPLSPGFMGHDAFGGLLPLAQPQPQLISQLSGALPVNQTDSPETATPPGASAGSTTTPESSPRDKSPCRSSKSSPSIKSAFKRRSWASVLSSISSGISSLARSSSSASSKGLNLNDTGANMALSKLSREDFLATLEEKPKKTTKAPQPANFFRKYSTYVPTNEELNSAVVKMCCSAKFIGTEDPAGCVHERLSRAISAQRSEGPAFRDFWVTEAEVNAQDKFGNSLLHVAARWGARVSLLLLILRHTYDVQTVNQRGETFLHVYDPPSHPRLRPASFLNLVRCLRSRGFDFCQRDADKQIFLHRLVAKKEFPVEVLHCVFREVGHGTARFLVANKAADGDRLYHRVCKNLEIQSSKLHRIFGDETEFIRRYLPEFSDSGTSSKASSTRDTSTPDSGRMSWMHGCPHCESHQFQTTHDDDTTDSSAQNVKRTPLMDLLHKIGSGRDNSDKDMEERIEKLLIAGAKGANQARDADLNARDTEGNTALHYAAEFGLVPAVKFLCSHKAPINVFNNCGNTPLQLVKYAIQRTDVRSDIHMEARYLRCAVILLEKGAFDQSKFVSERSMIFPYDVFDGSERYIGNLVKQGVANQCKGLHLLASSTNHHHHLPAICQHDDGHEHEERRSPPEDQMSLKFETSAIF